ncbi:MAG: S8 family serine peptidase, partial [Vicinamibacterales bacterium]
MMRRSIIGVAALTAVLVAFWGGPAHGILTPALLASQQPSPAAPAADGISPTALAQIQALFREKGLRTGGQLKIDSRLLVEMKRSYGEPIAQGLPVATGLPLTADQRLVLDVRANVTDALLDTLSGVAAEVVESDPSARHIRVVTDLWWLEAIASLPEVEFIQPRQEAATTRVGSAGWRGNASGAAPQPRRRLNREALVTAVRNALDAQGAIASGTGQGSRTSEGDATHRADSARATYGVTGSGVKIGVLSDGVAHLSSSQASGDLGAVTVLSGQTGTGDEGTAMLEIVHDLAPGAQLYFATAFTSITSFAQNIRNLRAAGCDIIVDDVYYYTESPFQDGQAASVLSTTNGGVVIQAVKDVTASGALYFSSAGNSGNLDAFTSGTWEGDFVDGGSTTLETGCPVPGCRVHSFGVQLYDSLTSYSGYITLFWSDPLGGSANDYDLIVLDSAGSSLIGYSTNLQNGSQDPFEWVPPVPPGSRVYIVRYAGSGRYLHLNSNGGVLAIATAGVTRGHAATSAPNSFGVAATPAVGPYPAPFNTGNVVEYFSSDGPRRVFFAADGAPFTPGNLSATGGVVLNKPDLTAADGVSVTGVGGFPSPFYGTSAAAPHAAAIAALIKSAFPSLSPAQIRTALLGTTIDVQSGGWDRDSGSGIVMADSALLGASASAAALTVSATQVPPGSPVTVTLTNGTGVALDWVALAGHTAPDTNYLQYRYVGAGVTTTTWTVTMPATLGVYEFRLFANDGYTRLATSPTVTVANINPVPTIGGLSPSGVAAGSAAFTLHVTGSGFVSGVSTVQWDGSPLTLTSGSVTQLNATVMAAQVVSQGTHTVRVVNPAPGGGVSNGSTFTVTAPPPVPIITTISPSSVAILGPAFALTVNGTGFAANSVVRIGDADRATTYVSSTQLTATILASDLTAVRTATITVFTPAPGGGSSNGALLGITGPALGVSASLVPPGAPVTVTLTNGVGGAKDWLALANSAAPDTSYLQYRYVGAGLTTATWTVT